jgi:Rrf2 family nitric oxide-sensitive transcriptional repressor
MRLTGFTDYGLRALMRLAAEPSRLFTTEEIAAAFDLSRHHLTKIVQDLAAAGILRTVRGPKGGIALARPPETITVGEVVRLLERGQAMVECFRADGGHCVLTPTCRLKGMLAGAGERFLAELDRYTLADCAYFPEGMKRAG